LECRDNIFDEWRDCDGDPANGCEVNISRDGLHCGACGASCDLPGVELHGTPRCDYQFIDETYECTATCDSGWADCDDSQYDCETPTWNAANCGGCGTCSSRRFVVSATCVEASGEGEEGQCVNVVCQSGRGNCDGDGNDGCEVNLNTAEAHCGACGNACATGETCSAGTCQLAP